MLTALLKMRALGFSAARPHLHFSELKDRDGNKLDKGTLDWMKMNTNAISRNHALE